MNISNNKTKKKHVAKKEHQQPGLMENAIFSSIDTDRIEFSPLNYRREFSMEDLETFSKELKQHGVLSPIIVRRKGEFQFELIAGERRLRAARIADMKMIPASIVELTDDQVVEVQLVENLQRENPHPMREAQGMEWMQKSGKSIEQIAQKLGKSKQYVFSRLRLLSLSESFRIVFLAGAIELKEAFLISQLSEADQNELFDTRFQYWEPGKIIPLYNLQYQINSFRCDLTLAPFDPNDKELLPDVGSCVGCIHNSASMRTLFPELADVSNCANRPCYEKKSSVYFDAELKAMLKEKKPTAFIANPSEADALKLLVDKYKDVAGLHIYTSMEVIQKDEPEIPVIEDFTYENDDNETIQDLDEFQQAMADYEEEKLCWRNEIEQGNYNLAIKFSQKELSWVFFIVGNPFHSLSKTKPLTSKEVQEAISTGDVTKEMLESELQRLTERELRLKELDDEKIQGHIHQLLTEFTSIMENNTFYTHADENATRFLIFLGLDYQTRQTIDELLFQTETVPDTLLEKYHQRYTAFANLSEVQFAHLIRVAICSKTEAKMARTELGYFTRMLAKETGIPIDEIESEQLKKRSVREGKLNEKIKKINGLLAKMN